MAKAKQLLHFGPSEVSSYFPSFLELLHALTDVMKDFSAKKLIQPLRTTIRIPLNDGRFISMPVCIPNKGIMGIKNVTAVPSNVDIGIPTHLANIQLYRLTGELICLMDGEEITAKRTAAVSAIATSHLADKESSCLAVIGAGTQARYHILALRELYDLKVVRIWNHNYDRAVKLSAELECIACESVSDACKGADIICTASSSAVPLLFVSHVKTGAHINVIGASSPYTREVADDLMLAKNLTVVCDSYEGAAVEAGDIIQTGAKVNHELGELLLSGDYKRIPGQITLFKNNGLACQDVISANLVYQNFIKSNSS